MYMLLRRSIYLVITSAPLSCITAMYPVSRLITFLITQVIVVANSSYYTGASCEAPLPVDNTITQPRILTSVQVGSYIMWSCMEGYTMESDTDIIVWVCNHDGIWIGDQPNCRAITCGTPAVPAFATVFNSGPYRVGDTITYQCAVRYNLQDTLFPNTCMPDGSWTNVLPNCNRTCPQSKFVFRYSNHTCFRRRALNSYKRGWDASRRLCADNQEILATVKDASTHRFVKETLQIPGQRDPGYSWIGAREGQDWMWNNSRRFIMRLFWRETIFETNARECISLGFHRSADTFWWDSASCSAVKNFICQAESSCIQSEFELGETSIDYRGNCYHFNRIPMSWESAGTYCQDKGGFLAEPLDDSTNLRLMKRARLLDVSATWWIGGKDFDINNRSSWFWIDNTRVTYFEWGSYEPNRLPYLMNCVQLDYYYDYTWSDVECTYDKRALCQIGFEACMDPGAPTHGHRMPDDVTIFHVGTHIEFLCDVGYELHGARSLTCLTNGTWNQDVPSCKSVVCQGDIPFLNNSESTTISSSYRGITIYSCNYGYIPDGPPFSRCQSDAAWSTPNFTCTILPVCYSEPCLNGGSCVDTGNGDYQCACPENFSGFDCNHEVPVISPTCYSTPCIDAESQDGKPSDGGMAAGIAVAMIFLVIFIFAFLIIYRRRRLGRSKQSDVEHEMDVPDNTIETIDPPGHYVTQPSPRNLDGQHSKTSLRNYAQDNNVDDYDIEGPSSNTELVGHTYNCNSGITTERPRDQLHFNNPSYCNTNMLADHTYDQSYSNASVNLYDPANNDDGFVNTVVDDINDGVERCLDENIYANYEDGETVLEKELVRSATLRTAACEERFESANDEIYQYTDDNVYSNYKEKEEIAGNPTLLHNEHGEFYQNAEFHSVPSDMVENELYTASTMPMLGDDQYDAVIDEGSDDVNSTSDHPDENIYANYEDGETVCEKDLVRSVTLRTAACEERFESANDEINQNTDDNVYSNYKEKEEIAGNPTLLHNEHGEFYQNVEFHLVPSDMVENDLYTASTMPMLGDDQYDAVIDEGRDDVNRTSDHPDENIYADCDDDAAVGDNGLCGPTALSVTAHDQQFQNSNGTVYEAVYDDSCNSESPPSPRTDEDNVAEQYTDENIYANYKEEEGMSGSPGCSPASHSELFAMIADGHDEVYQKTDENIYANSEDKEDVFACGSASGLPDSNVEEVNAATDGHAGAKADAYQRQRPRERLYANYEHDEDKEGRYKGDDDIYSNVASPSAFRDAETNAVICGENVKVSRNIDTNIYSNYEEDGGNDGDGLSNSASLHTPYGEQYDANITENIYSNYEDDGIDIVDNKNQLGAVVDEHDEGELYQNAEFHAVPTNLVENELYKSMDEI